MSPTPRTLEQWNSFEKGDVIINQGLKKIEECLLERFSEIHSERKDGGKVSLCALAMDEERAVNPIMLIKYGTTNVYVALGGSGLRQKFTATDSFNFESFSVAWGTEYGRFTYKNASKGSVDKMFYIANGTGKFRKQPDEAPGFIKEIKDGLDLAAGEKLFDVNSGLGEIKVRK